MGSTPAPTILGRDDPSATRPPSEGRTCPSHLGTPETWNPYEVGTWQVSAVEGRPSDPPSKGQGGNTDENHRSEVTEGGVDVSCLQPRR